MPWLRGGAVGGLLVASFILQAYFLTHYPQPILFGDPAGYYLVGHRLHQAWSRLAAGEPWGPVYESIRGYLYFAGVGSLYALIDSLRPKDVAFFRLVLAGFNTLALLGCYVLTKRLSGSFAAGLLALAAACLYPSLSVQTGRLFPEPVIGCLFVWATVFYVLGVERSRGRLLALAGLSLTAGLFIRSQVITYVSALLVIVVLGSLPLWWKRWRLGLALLAGILPFTLLWFGIVRSVGDDHGKISDLGFFYFPRQHRFPYGFWLFLESDGWLGPYQLTEYPFAKDLETATGQDPQLLASRAAQYRFVAQYLWARPRQATSQFLENVYRLYRQPANDYRWDYPIPLGWQRGYQALLIVLGTAGLALAVTRRPELAGIVFLPATLVVMHALSFPLPRYAQPVMFVFVAAAAYWLVAVLRERTSWRWGAGLVAAAGLGLIALGTNILLPEVARIFAASADLLALATVFMVTARIAPRRWPILLAGLLFGVLVLAHAIRTPTWHQVEVELGEKTVGVEQEVTLSEEGLAHIRSAREAFVVFDLEVPRGGLRGARLEVGGRSVPVERLVPTIPRLGESTAAGGRDNRTYRQWWALPLSPDLLPDTPERVIRVALDVPSGREVRLFADRWSEQERTHEGPSFGDWPHLATLKLEYDGDYRLPIRRSLRSLATKSFVRDPTGTRQAAPYVHRIRIVTLENDGGHITWESDSLPRPRVAAVWSAYSGSQGEAELIVDQQPRLRFPLGSRRDFEVEAGNSRLCYHALPDRSGSAYGRYVLITGGSAKPLLLTVRYSSGMSTEPLFYTLDLKAAGGADVCAAAAAATPVNGAARILDGSANTYPQDTGRFRVAEVY